jgi:hypothetical protein
MKSKKTIKKYKGGGPNNDSIPTPAYTGASMARIASAMASQQAQDNIKKIPFSSSSDFLKSITKPPSKIFPFRSEPNFSSKPSLKKGGSVKKKKK